MASATLTSKGQLTVPADVRRALRISSGDRVEFVQIGPDRFEIIAATGSVKNLQGMFGPANRSASVEEMNEAIAASGAGE